MGFSDWWSSATTTTPSAAPEPTVIKTGTTLKTGTVLNSKNDPVVHIAKDGGGYTAQNKSTLPAATFDDAFAENRAAGNETFTYNGNLYTTEVAERLSGDNLFSNYDVLPSTSTSNLTEVELPNGRSYYADEAGTFIGLVPENEVEVEKTDYQNKLEAAGESDLSGLDQVAATNVDYTGVSNTNPVASTDDYNDTVVVADPVSQTPFDDSTTSSGKDYTEAATSDTDESLTAYTDVVTNAPETTDVVTNAPETETYNGETVQVKYLDYGKYADNPLKYYVNSNGNYVGLAPRDYTTTATTTTSGGRNLDDDLGVGGSEATVTASELLNDDIATDNTTTYSTPSGGGVTLSDDNAKAIDQIISGGSTASSIVGGGTTTPAASSPATTDPIGGYSSLTQEDFIKEADAVITPFSDMTPEQAEVLGLSDIYKPGDMILPQDLDLLKDAGYTVAEESYDAFGDEYDTAEEAAQADIDMGIGETSSYTPTISSSSTGSRPGYDYASTPGQVAYTGTGGSEIDKYDPRNIMPTSEQLAIASGAAQEVVNKTPSITPERLEDLQGYVDSLTSMQGGYTEADLDAAGFTASEILAFEQGLSVPGLKQDDIDAMEEQYGTLQEAPNSFESAANAIRGGSDLTLGEIAAGLGYDTVGGFLEELSLRAKGTGQMADDALSILSSYNIDQYEFTDPNTGEKVIADLDGVDRTGTTITAASDILGPAAKYLSGKAKEQFDKQSDAYKETVRLGMPNPDNEGYNMAGEKITPGLWMASVAAQELIGLGMDVGSVVLLGPVAGGALTLQQGVAEAGRASADEVLQEMEELKAQGAFDNMSEEDYNKMVSSAEKQAFYTSGIAGGAVDTITALTAGGFAPLAKALPKAIRSGLIASGVVTAEGISGGLEQVGVNAAVIKALEDQGIDPADYDKEYLDKVLTAAIYEVVGGTGSGAAAGVGSYVSNLSSESDTGSEGNLSPRLDEDYFSVDSTGAGESLLNEMNKEGSDISVVGNNEMNATGGYDEYTLIDNNTGKTETVSAADFNTSQEGESGALAGGVGGTGSKKKQLVLGGTSVETVTNRQGEAVEVVTITDGNGNTTVTIGDTSQIVSGGENSVVTDPNTGVSVNVNASNTADITSTAGLVNEIAAETNTDPTTLLSGSTVNVSVADPFTEAATDAATDVVTDAATDAVTDAATDAVTDISVGSVIDANEPVPSFLKRADTFYTPLSSYTPDSGPAPVGETAAGYTSGIAGFGGVRPTVAPRYQSRSVGQYTPYLPESGVIKTPTGPASATPSTYLAETAQGGMRYGNPYILPNADPELLAQLARLQGTGDARLPAEYLLNDEDLV